MTQKRIPNHQAEEPKVAPEVLAPDEPTPFDAAGPDAPPKPKKKQEPLDMGLLEAAVAIFGVAALAGLFDGEGETADGDVAGESDLADGFDI